MRNMTLNREPGIIQDLSPLTNKPLTGACLPKLFNWLKLIRITIQFVVLFFCRRGERFTLLPHLKLY